MLRSSLIKEENAPLGGQLTVRASSASLADPLEARCPIKVDSAGQSVDFREHLWRRLFFFPEDVRDAVADVLQHF